MAHIPKEAQKKFDGVIFDVYQWEQKMYDGSTETFERLKRTNTVNVIAVSGDKIFITHQEQPDLPPFYSFIGGRQDHGETPEETAKRELLEEAGMVAESMELFHTVEPYNKIDWTVYTYIAKECTQVQDQQLDAGEKITIKTISFDKLMDMARNASLREKEFTLLALRMQLIQEEMEIFRKKLFE